MLAKSLTLAGLATAVAAQSSMNFSAALASVPELSNLTAYLAPYSQLVGQLQSLQNITLLAPSNTAFAKLMNSSQAGAINSSDVGLITAVFDYHILNGTYYASQITKDAQFLPTYLTRSTNLTLLDNAVVEGLLVGNSTKFVSGLLTESTVTQANVNFTGGTIHVIDTFMTYPQNISATIVTLNETATAGALEKANAAAGAASLSNLTAFIPNNEAWQAISSTAANLSTEQLQGILGYHIVPNFVAYSTLLQSNMTLPTTANSTLKITNMNGTLFVNDAKIVTPDVLVQEGIVHIIDEVLNPANSTIAPNASKTQVAFPTGSATTELPFTSNIPAPSTVPAQATGGATQTATGGAGATASGSAGSSSSKGAAAPMQTGAIGAAALFGGAALMMNF